MTSPRDGGTQMEARNMSKCGTLLRLGASLLFGICVGAPMAQQPVTPRPTAPPASVEQLRKTKNRLAWSQRMAAHPKPNTGCFAAAYPSEEWKETQCGIPPKMPHNRPPTKTNWLRAQAGTIAKAKPGGLAVTGNGDDAVAVAVGERIRAVEGFFDQTVDISSVASASATQSAPGYYALQINVAPFDTPACGN